MGNCLCCCRERRSNEDRYCPDSHLTKKELVFGFTQVSLDQRTGTPTGDNSNITNGNSHMKPATDKRMFSPRKPPIVAGAGDSKRGSQNREISEPKLNTLFEHYKDPYQDAILSEGIERLCQDLEVRPEEFKVLLLAWKFGAETMCQFTQEEFTSGCRKLKVDSVKSIQSKFSDLLKEVEDAECFKDLYRFTYKFGLDVEIGQRILPVDMAVGLWKLVFSLNEPRILKRWIIFLEKHPIIRGIPKDTWNMFLNLCEAVDDDLSQYDDTEAWPSLFDDFVEYENDQTNQNVPKMDGSD